MDTKKDDRPKIVVIDDESEFLSLIERWLKTLYRVTALYGSAWTFDQVAGLKPDLVLLDVNMPEQDGFELCRRMRADPRFQNVPIVFLTATPRHDAFRELGAARWLSKPIGRRDLLAAVGEELAPMIRLS
jgi:CheY-like chemotaxis protein